MKIRSREINIVSMSALDMFCSALGAFMFLAILFSLFAPNLGPKAEEVAAIKRENQTLKEQLSKAETERDAAIEELKRGLQQRATDIAIVIDTTASMQQPIGRLKEEIRSLSMILNKLTDQARIAIVEYKDYCMGSAAVRVQPLTLIDANGLQQLQSFANSLEAGVPCTNEEAEEQVLGGLIAARGLDWKANPDNRFIVVIGDNPPRSADEIAQAFAFATAWGGSGARLSAFVEGDSATAMSFYSELAQRGNGKVPAPGSSFALSLLIAMAE